ncbi:hypothetical protein ACTXT7_016245, partial [Hymenolepis weldensis]
MPDGLVDIEAYLEADPMKTPFIDGGFDAGSVFYAFLKTLASLNFGAWGEIVPLMPFHTLRVKHQFEALKITFVRETVFVAICCGYCSWVLVVVNKNMYFLYSREGRFVVCLAVGGSVIMNEDFGGLWSLLRGLANRAAEQEWFCLWVMSVGSLIIKMCLGAGYDLLYAYGIVHSASIRGLDSNMDAIPGRLNHLFFCPELYGLFVGYCAELCGVNHRVMPICYSGVVLFCECRVPIYQLITRGYACTDTGQFVGAFFDFGSSWGLVRYA